MMLSSILSFGIFCQLIPLGAVTNKVMSRKTHKEKCRLIFMFFFHSFHQYINYSGIYISRPLVANLPFVFHLLPPHFSRSKQSLIYKRQQFIIELLSQALFWPISLIPAGIFQTTIRILLRSFRPISFQLVRSSFQPNNNKHICTQSSTVHKIYLLYIIDLHLSC